MNIENEIERMANEIAKSCPDLIEDSCDGVPCVSCIAKALINAGYGDKKQAVKEFAEKLKTSFYNMDYSAIAIDNKIDDLIADLYGEDE